MMIVASIELLFATESKELERDIKALIVKIKKADTSQKRILINELKLKVQKVNLAKKEQVIHALRQSLKADAKHTPIDTKSHKIKPTEHSHKIDPKLSTRTIDIKPTNDLHKPLPPTEDIRIEPSDLQKPPPPDNLEIDPAFDPHKPPPPPK